MGIVPDGQFLGLDPGFGFANTVPNPGMATGFGPTIPAAAHTAAFAGLLFLHASYADQ